MCSPSKFRVSAGITDMLPGFDASPLRRESKKFVLRAIAAFTAVESAALRAILNAAVAGANGDILSTSALASMTGLNSITGLASINSQQYTRGGVRQTVSASSVDSGGLPNFLTTVGTLNLPIAATATGLRVTAANGFNENGPVNRNGSISADTTLLLPASSTNYVYADIAADGTLTFGSTTLIPVYQFGGTYSTTSGQFTFNICDMIGKVGNGSAAVQTYRVFIGQAVTSGGAVTSVVNYALNRRYYAEAAIPANGTAVVFSHNLGVPSSPFSVYQVGYLCTTNDATMLAVVGDFVPLSAIDNGVSAAFGIFHGRLSTTINGLYTSIAYASKSNGTRAGIAAVSNFKMVLSIASGW